MRPGQVAQAAREAVAAGANEIHLHPRDAQGHESVAPDHVAAADSAGGSGFDRAEQIRARTVRPDCASVNWHERGALTMVDALRERDVAVEAGLWTPAAVRQFRSDGVTDRCRRILLEPMAQDPVRAPADAERMIADASPAGLPILLHGVDDMAWPLFELAVTRGLQVRVGLEDMLSTPDRPQARDQPPTTNADLVQAASTLAGAILRSPSRG